MLKRFIVKKNQRAALLRNGDFECILDPGRHYRFDLLNELSLALWQTDTPMPDTDLVDTLRRNDPAEAERHFLWMEMSEDEVGLRYENEVLVEMLPPASRRIFWRGGVAQRLEKLDLGAGAALPGAMVKRLLQPALRGRPVLGLNGVLVVQVPAAHVGVLRLDGVQQPLLAPGVTAYWRFNRDLQVDLVDMRWQSLEVSGQEILTRDKVALRLNLAATWRFEDVSTAFARLAKPAEHLYRELQFGLRAAVGTRNLDELLENKQLIDEAVSAHVARKLAGFGLEIGGVGVKDIVLPGEMKAILAQVVQAGKAAEANVIRRREETAATRSLLNTAKVMEDNPVALRLKELETLERVAERIDRISVFGGLDQVLNGLVTLAK
ncbi:MAG: slipin family protein [Azonexus sp.]|nr:slipin family protein [Betaproteobacteria bacterium]MBK8919351.1 slipin family protein [Betaproteobacteria bacterium]MBP6035281.1 slipin family protein [Azonexus sp.]MBP6905864.1 slipin family protein [Azonexus sp.]